VRSRDPEVRKLVAGPAVFGREKLCVYSGATLSLNPHHPMNDIVGVNTRTFELAAAGACQLVDAKDELSPLFKPGDEVLVYRDLPELRRLLDHFLARPDEARAIGENARHRALAEHTLAHRVDEMLNILEDRFAVDARPSGPGVLRRDPDRTS
jgi:spore maturation protein CgeB